MPVNRLITFNELIARVFETYYLFIVRRRPHAHASGTLSLGQGHGRTLVREKDRMVAFPPLVMLALVNFI